MLIVSYQVTVLKSEIAVSRKNMILLEIGAPTSGGANSNKILSPNESEPKYFQTIIYYSGMLMLIG